MDKGTNKRTDHDVTRRLRNAGDARTACRHPPDLRGEATGTDRPARLRGRRYSDPHTRAQPCFGPSFVEAADSRIGGGSALNAQREIGEYYSRQRSEEQTSELTSLMSILYAVFWLKNKKTQEQ